MKLHPTPARASESGSALVVTMGVLTVLALVAANVLMNCTTRYNSSFKQVKGWKEALLAAEAGADLAFAEIRLNGLDSTKGFASANNWASPAPSPVSATNSWELGYTRAAPTFGQDNSLSAKVTVDKFQMLPGSTTTGYYRIRSIGTAKAAGLKRVGMDDRVDGSTRGDSLLRKIDFNYQAFWATYGYGDALATAAGTTANGKAAITVAGTMPQVSRRIELVVVPIMAIEGAVKTVSGVYSFPFVDSYSSAYGPYPGTPTPATAPYNTASGQGNVVDGSSTFNGQVYGDVTTNGGNARVGPVTGVIDNNVPVAPVANMPYTHGVYEAQTSGTITPPARAISSSMPIDNLQQTTFWYHYTSINGLTINPAPALYASAMPSGGIVETTVNVVCDNDVSGITVNKGVHANIYFYGDVGGKADSYDNNNVDGPGGNGVYTESSRSVTDAITIVGSTTLTSARANFTAADVGDPVSGTAIPAGAKIASVPNATTAVMSVAASNGGAVAGTVYSNFMLTVGNYAASSDTSRANHLWIYGEGNSANQQISLQSGGPATNYVCWYAPNADWSTRGNPDFVGCAVVKSFTGNGNNTMHFDTALLSASNPIDFRVASYVEDVR